jgi:hypothetical protein
VLQALFDLTKKPPRFQAHPDNSALIECPRARLLRIGQEAELEGKPSELFRHLMERTANGAMLPHVTERAIKAAQGHLNIALKFKEFTGSNKAKYESFKELKRRFRITCQFTEETISESTLERALKAHDINWSAYAINTPRKGARKKRA